MQFSPMFGKDLEKGSHKPFSVSKPPPISRIPPLPLAATAATWVGIALEKKNKGSSPVSEAKGNDSMKAIDGDVRLFQNRWFPSLNCNRIWACGTPRFETEQSFLNPPQQQPEISALKKTAVQGALSVGMMMKVVPSFSGLGARAFATGQMGVVLIRPTLKPINSKPNIGYSIPYKKKTESAAESLHVSCMDCGLSKRGITWRTGATRGFKLSHRELRRPCQRWSPQCIPVFPSMLVTANLLSRRFHHSQ